MLFELRLMRLSFAAPEAVNFCVMFDVFCV
jgi:hypothetical protein